MRGIPGTGGDAVCKGGSIAERAGGSGASPRLFLPTGEQKNPRSMAAKGTQCFPPVIEDLRWRWQQSELLVFVGVEGGDLGRLFRRLRPGGGHMAGSSVWRAGLASDRQQRAEPLLGKGGCAKRGLRHRCRPAARYAPVPRGARSLRGSVAQPARRGTSVQTSRPLLIPRQQGTCGGSSPPPSMGLGQAGVTVCAVVAGCKCR